MTVLLFLFACLIEPAHRSDETAPTIAVDAEAPTCTDRVGPAGDSHVSVEVAGVERSYELHVPASYDPGVPTPTLLAFHGGGGNPLGVELGSHLVEKSDREGFVLVGPNGTLDPPLVNPHADARYWNGGSCCGGAKDDDVDDILFVRAILDDLEARYCIDADRVYATGISNGGTMSYRLACELADRVAAVAPVAGTFGRDDLSACLVPCDPESSTQAQCLGPCEAPPSYYTCQPARPIPLMELHGTIDTVSPYEGGTGLKDGNQTPRPRVRDSIAFFRDHNGCATEPVVTYEVGEAVCETFTDCEEGADVTLCSIANGGHTWPGGYVDAPACYEDDFVSKVLCSVYVAIVGPISPDITAVDEMWEFFEAHPRP